MKTYKAQQPSAPPSYSDRQFLHSYQSGALIPLVQSTINAGAGMLITAVLLYAVDAMDYVKPIVVIGALSWVGSWIYFLRRWISLTTLEHRLDIDLNSDGIIGEPEEPRISTVWIDLRKVDASGNYSNSKFPLPNGVTEEHLEQIARDMFIYGRTFAETELSGPGKISLPKFRQLREVMKVQGLCEKVGDARNAPFELTEQGEAWLREHLTSSPPLPMEEV